MTHMRVRLRYIVTGAVFIGLLTAGITLWQKQTLRAAPGPVTGLVFNDANANGVKDAGEGAFANLAIVNLYDSLGNYVKSRTSDANGNYSISGLAAGTYYLTLHNSSVPSATSVAPGLIDTIGVRLEQTYASVGAGAGSGSGPICVGAGPAYSQRANYSATPSEWIAGAANGTNAGPCFGGRQGAGVNTVTSGTRASFAASSDYTNLGVSLNQQEHVMKVVVTADSGVSNVDFGMSANAVVNTATTGQGSLKQFIDNANLIAGANAMRFSPTVVTNQSNGADAWWRIDHSTVRVPALSGANAVDTTIDGRAFSNIDGSTQLERNIGTFGGVTVGTTNYAIAAFAKPELELYGDPVLSGTQTPLVETSVNNTTVRSIGFNSSVNYPLAASYFVKQTAGTGLSVFDNTLGVNVSTTAAFATRPMTGIEASFGTTAATTGSIKHNYISAATEKGLQLANGVAGAGNVVAANLGDWTLEDNTGPSASVNFGAGTNKILVKHNNVPSVFVDASLANSSVGNHTILENTVSGSNGVYLHAADNNTIQQNVIKNSATGFAGVTVNNGATGNKITRNNFSANAGNSIDLGANGVSANASVCVGASLAGANGNLARPTLAGLNLSGGSLTLNGTFCSTGSYDIELYKAASDGDGNPAAGEGGTYLGTLSNVTGGTLTNQVLNVTGLAATDAITVLAINRTTGDTSELSVNAALTVPGTPDMTAATDTGLSNTDNITNNLVPSFTGSCTTGETLNFYVDDILIAPSNITCTAGAYTYAPLSNLTEGTHTIYVRSTTSGGVGQSQSLAFTIDATLPAVPGVTDLTAATDTGVSQVDDITNVNQPVFIGSCTTGETITLFVDTVVRGSQVCAASIYTITVNAALSEGAHLVQTSATDPAGNQSAKSIGLSIAIDTTAPSALSAPDLTPGSDSGLSDTDNITNINQPILSGSCSSGDIITLYIGATAAGNVTCAANLYAITATPAIADGTVTATVRAADVAGNQSPASAGLTLTISTAVPGVPTSAPDMTAATDTGFSNTDNITSNATPAFTVACGSDAIAKLYVDGVLASQANCASGSATITPSPALSDGPHTVTYKVANVAGNESLFSPPLVAIIDTVAPGAPTSAPDLTAATDSGISDTDNITNNTQPVFAGACLTGETATLFVDNTANGSQVCVAGLYAISPTTALANGSHAIAISFSDAAGNQGAKSPTLLVTIDTTAPTTPGTPDMTAATDTGTSNTDNITNNQKPIFTGSCAADSQVELLVDGLVVASQTCASGSYSLEPGAAVLDGNHSATVRATDAAGNTSNQSTALSFTIATTAPVPPSTPDLISASDSGVSNIDNITNDNTPTLTGVCTNGSTVHLFAGAIEVGQASCSGNAYSITASTLSDGEKLLSVNATDAAGNTSANSVALLVVIDTAAPAVLAAPDMTSLTDTGVSQTDNITNAPLPVFTGACVAGDTVTLYINGTMQTTTICAANAYALTPSSPLSGGSFTATVRATDVAGNQNAASAGLTFSVDVTAPAAPVISSPADGTSTNDSTPTISGTGENGATVAVVDQNAITVCTATVSGGNWSCTPDPALVDGSHTLRARQIDVAGNISPNSNAVTITIDGTAPLAPVVTSPLNGSITNSLRPTFSGSGEANANVKLYLDGASSPINITANASGNWTYTPANDLSNGAHSFYVTQVDAAGNVSPQTPTINFTIDTTALGVTVNKKAGQADPSTAQPVYYTVTFSKAINSLSFSPADITLATSPSAPTTVITSFVQQNATTWEVGVGGLPNHTTVTASIAANKVKDAAGNDNTASTSTDNSIEYNVPPPNIDKLITNDTTPTLEGECAANNSLKLTFSGAASNTFTLTCGSNGKWTFTVPNEGALVAGTYNVEVEDTTIGLSNDPLNRLAAATIDLSVPLVSISRAEDQPNPTNVNSAAFTVTFSESIVASTLITADLTLAGTSGSISDLTQLSPTTWRVVVTGMTSGDTASLSLGVNKVTDVAGNGNSASVGVNNSVTFDNTPPVAPGIVQPAANAILNNARPVVSGSGENAAVVYVRIDGSPVLCAEANPVVVSGGIWTCTLVSDIAQGAHVATVLQIDLAGNNSPSSNNTPFIVDSVAPAAPAAPDLTVGSDSGSSNTDNVTNVTTPTFTGACLEGTTIKLFANGEQKGQQACQTGGTYSITTSPALLGNDYLFTVDATDDAGNESEMSEALPVRILTAPPSAPAAPDLAAGSDSGASDSDNITNITTPTFTGSCAAGETMKLYVDGALAGQQVCDANGTYSITASPALSNGTHTARLSVTDPAGNESAQGAALSLTIDTTPATTPAVTAPAANAVITTQTPTISGTGTAGDTITVRNGGAVVCTATVQSDGTWSCAPASPLADNTYTLTVTATDPAGNQSSGSTSRTFTVDTTPPSVPSAPDLANSSDTGSSNTDNITSDTTPTLTGNCVNGTVIKLYDGATLIAQQTCANGTYTLTLSTPLDDGQHALSVSATDSAGNESAKSAALMITIDTAQPAAPAAPTLDPSSDTGSSNTDGNTSNRSPIFTGTCEPGSTVTLYVDGNQSSQQSCGSNGTYSIQPGSNLSDSSHTITVTVTNAAGNTSNASQPTTVTVDSTFPSAPTVTSPDEGATIGTMPAFSGSGGTNGDTVTVKENGTTVCSALVQQNGTWSCSATGSGTDGSHTYQITATDTAGNTSPATTRTITIDATPPPAPVIIFPADGQDVNQMNPAIGGTGQPGDTIEIIDNMGVVRCRTTVQQDGTWSCTPTYGFGEGWHSFTARQIDAVGNVSPPSAPTEIMVMVNTDGATAETEDAAPNNGDGNADGELDSEQANVTSKPNPLTGNAYNTLQVSSNECQNVTDFEMESEQAMTVQDPDRQYPLGLWEFAFDCADPGATATVTIFLDKQYDTSNWIYKKFNRNTQQYRDISNLVTYGTANVGNATVTTITLQATDGGELDEDGIANGSFRDPSGPTMPNPAGQNPSGQPGTGNQNGGLADTGAAIWLPIAAALTLLMISILTILKLRKARA